MSKFLISVFLLFGLSVEAATTAATAATGATTPSVTTADSKVVNVTLTKDNVLVMNDYFYGQSVANLSQQAKQLDAKLKAKDPLFLVINSGGGSIEAGIELIENLNRLNRPVHTITLFAASMGFQTVQGVGGVRLIQDQGTLMSHKARGMFYGEFPGQLDSRYNHYLKRVFALDKKAVARTKGKHTLKSYHSLIENEYWCDGQDCIDQGFADRIVNASCDKSLSGTKEVLWDRFLYMGHVIEIVDTYSECPIITYELSYQVYIDGEPLFETYKTSNSKSKEENLYNYNRTILDRLGIETAENVRKMIDVKLTNRVPPSANRKEIRKY